MTWLQGTGQSSTTFPERPLYVEAALEVVDAQPAMARTAAAKAQPMGATSTVADAAPGEGSTVLGFRPLDGSAYGHRHVGNGVVTKLAPERDRPA